MTQEEKPPSPTQKKLPYGGYYNRPQVSEDTLLTHVGPGTPCGEYMRRYWHPFLIASELKDLPVAVRLLGEDLVAFRDKSGRLGLLHRNCAHRGASLEFGIPAERGIRCCYHGWHFDVDGTILDTPAEPEASRIRTNFCQGAYRIREQHGLLFAYMGPPEDAPELPVYDTLCHPDTTIAPFKITVPCNWLQIVENAADPIHNAFLHAIMSESGQFGDAFKVLPVLDFPETPIGMLSMATRKLNDTVFIRAGELMLPNVAQFTTGAGRGKDLQETVRVHSTTTRWAVPVDDRNALYIGAGHWDERSAPRSRSLDDYGVDKMPLLGQTAERPYKERQREPGDYDAVVSAGAIVNRKAEHLGTTDRGVALIRRMLAHAIITTSEGKVPAIPRWPQDGGPVQTYCHEVVLKLPDAAALADRRVLGEFGNRAAKAIIEFEGLTPDERDESARTRIIEILRECCANGGAAEKQAPVQA
jgi:nitrite reductase/ring-hydroxylating ferredoxin subunit